MTIVEVDSTTEVNYRYSGIQKAFTRYFAIFGDLDDRQQYSATAIFFPWSPFASLLFHYVANYIHVTRAFWTEIPKRKTSSEQYHSIKKLHCHVQSLFILKKYTLPVILQHYRLLQCIAEFSEKLLDCAIWHYRFSTPPSAAGNRLHAGIEGSQITSVKWFTICWLWYQPLLILIISSFSDIFKDSTQFGTVQ